MSARNLGINICLALVSVFFTFMLVEFVFRYHWQPASLFMKKASALYQYDELLGWSLVPNKRVERKTAEYRVIEVTNSFGLRSPELSLGKEPGEFRILFLGDSFAQGYTVEWKKTYAEVVRQLVANSIGRKVSVVNGGCAGWSTDQQLLWYERNGKQWNADFVVLLFFDNDLWYNTQSRYWRGFKPRFAIEDNKLKLLYRPAKPEKWQPTSLFAHSHLLVYFHSRLSHIPQVKSLTNILGFELPKVSDVPNFSVEFNRFLPQHPVTVDGWRITEALLKRLFSEVKKEKGKFLLFQIPNRWFLYGDSRRKLLERYGKRAKEWKLGYISKRLHKFCIKNNIPSLEPTSEFKQSKKRLYLTQDGHWNEDGHSLVGKQIGNFIVTSCKDK